MLLDMYRPKSRFRELVIRISTYALMTITVIALVALSSLYMLGYRFDTRDNSVEQTGLLQFITTPPGAVIEVDGAAIAEQSPAKATVLPGSHEFVMWREGYETWRKSLDIAPGSLTWLNYTRLIPKSRPIDAVHTLPNVQESLASPDRRFMAVMTESATPAIMVYDLTRDTVPPPTTITLTDLQYEGATSADMTHRFTLQAWDKSGRFLLVKHAYADTKIEWLVYDRQDKANHRNITKTMGIELSDVQFTDTSGRQFVGLEANGTIRYINLADETVSRPIVSNISSFYLDYDSQVIAYIEHADDSTGYRSAGVIKKGRKPVTIYRSQDDHKSAFHIKAAHYFGQDYVSVADGSKVTIFAGAYPVNENDTMKEYATFTTQLPVETLHVSPTGRFVIAQTGAEFVSYDIERKVTSAVATLKGATPAHPLRWLDDFIVWSDRSGELVIREFDGANEHGLGTVVEGQAATLSVSGKYLYSIGKTPTGAFQLQRVKLIL